MRIRTKVTLLVTGLIAAVVASVVVNLLWVEQRRVREESGGRIDALMEGVLRISRESLNSHDELMLLSYLKFLMQEYPEIELALVSREGHSSVFGSARSELFYRTITVSDTGAVIYRQVREVRLPAGASSEPPRSKTLPPSSVMIQLGFSKAALQRQIREAQIADAVKLLWIAGMGLLIGVAGSVWVSRRLAEPVSSLAAAARRIGEGRLDTVVDVSTQDEIGDLARQFNRMAANIRELIRFKEDLLNTMTHELNNPLVGLKGYLQFLQDSKSPQSPEEIREAYKTMGEAFNQMELSLTNALQLFRADARPELRPERFCLNDVLKEVIRLFRPAAQSNGIMLRGPNGEAPVYLDADQEMVRRVAVNLVSNALKYTKAGGKVSVWLEEDPRQVRFAVSDTGSGIAPDDREKIFLKFYRAAGSGGKAQRIPGSGLGLAISKRAVDMHGGKIWVESELGRGSVFRVSLPKQGAGYGK